MGLRRFEIAPEAGMSKDRKRPRKKGIKIELIRSLESGLPPDKGEGLD